MTDRQMLRDIASRLDDILEPLLEAQNKAEWRIRDVGLHTDYIELWTACAKATLELVVFRMRIVTAATADQMTDPEVKASLAQFRRRLEARDP